MTAAAERRDPRAPGAGVAGTGPLVPATPAGPSGRARALAARLLVTRMAARLPVRIEFPDGQALGAGARGAPLVRLHDPDAFFARIGAGTAGFAESYMAGDWDCTDLAGLFEVLAGHLTGLVPRPLGALRRWYVPQQPAGDEATRDGARRNIQRHYDLSDDLFALFLDPGMTYSSALFEPGDTLERAQHRKIDRLLDLTGVGPGRRVLEIGTGWGELALRAAARGARVTSLTISAAQWAAATRRCEAAGLADRVDVQLRDYRDATGRYDAVLSVEMIEAVGAAYWPEYFRAIDRLLGPGGLAGLQAITMPHDRMLATMGGHSWIHQYIFPGGQIPSLEAITGTLAGHTGLAVRSDLAMGQHYATTLRHWRERFTAAADDVGRLGFSPAFRRMWELYLAYSEGGFRAGYLDAHQLILGRSGT